MGTIPEDAEVAVVVVENAEGEKTAKVVSVDPNAPKPDTNPPDPAKPVPPAEGGGEAQPAPEPPPPTGKPPPVG